MNQKKTSEYIFQILDEAILEVGVENVVQVVTDSAANCVGAGKLIVEKYPQIYWSPCAAHCLDLLLHDLAKFPWIHEAIHRGRAVANFIRNHRLTLSLYRQHASRELLRPCDTRFASFYITLKRVIEEKAALRLVVCSNEWESSAFSKSAKGKNIEQIILSSNFWESGAKVLNICGPIVDVLRMVDEAEYMEIWETVDSRWKMMHTPLHAAACYLEPKLFHIDRQANPEIMPGFYEAISRFEQDRTIAGLIRDQSWKYRRAEGLFGIEAARDDMTRDEVPGYRWWMSYGAQNPELQCFAIRILSQGANSSASNDSTSSSQQRISEGMVTGVADEPEDDFVDDELGSDTDHDDATTATQPCALDDLELF
ncbi:uncharacterized protein LOC131059865 [Cryptomeria japonica]|uniref:uncharacterized protein LOC131059865 n=1 Tax=Cryptomeria japonica TaxID=3369 RepID=UPI0027D9EF5F|nr:uncharacterized protein LOC131059865 [Cryptomeria japonica]